METVLEIGAASAAPGERVKGHLDVAWLCDATPVEIPFIMINGVKPGPCLWIQGGLHGDEYVGPMAIQDLARVAPAEISGALILFPAVNILAFRAGSRTAPQDGLDMNRIWPGNPPEGAVHVYTHSELVVYQLASWMLSLADAVIDCHSGGWPHLMSPYTRIIRSQNEELTEICRAMGRATGLPLLWETPASDYEKEISVPLGAYLHKEGVPSITVEIGGQGRVTKKDRELMVRSLQGIARSLGVLSGRPDVRLNQMIVHNGNWVRAQRGGMLTPLVSPLERVEQGQAIAHVRDLLGAIVEEIHAPRAGVIIGHRTMGMVNSGQYVGNIGELEAA